MEIKRIIGTTECVHEAAERLKATGWTVSRNADAGRAGYSGGWESYRVNSPNGEKYEIGAGWGRLGTGVKIKEVAWKN